MASKLFSPITLRELSIKNRIFASPMCQYSAQEGIANNWHLVHLGGLACGGSGLVITEATAVSPEGRITPNCLGIWNDEQVNAFKPIVQFIKDQGAVPGIQLAHAGRKASSLVPWEGGGNCAVDKGGWQTVAPSALAITPNHPAPAALDLAEIERIKQNFVDGAKRALEAGFEIIEIHAAHGYLLHQFLSPVTNQREDQYGGSLENRCRFVLEVAQALRQFWPAEKPVFVRISATDWITENGRGAAWDLEQSVQLAKWLKAIGIDFIDCSSGGLVPDVKIPAGPGYQTNFASTIKQAVDIAVGAVGIITDPVQAEHIVVTEQADAVLLARALLRDPRWPLGAAKALHAEIKWLPQYERASHLA